MRGSSEKFGPCQICGGHASEMYGRTIEERFETFPDDPPAVRREPFAPIPIKAGGWITGHRECLEMGRGEG